MESINFLMLLICVSMLQQNKYILSIIFFILTIIILFAIAIPHPSHYHNIRL